MMLKINLSCLFSKTYKNCYNNLQEIMIHGSKVNIKTYMSPGKLEIHDNAHNNSDNTSAVICLPHSE